MQKRKEYVRPTTDYIEVRYSGIICISPNPKTSFYLGGAGVYDGEGIIDNGDY